MNECSNLGALRLQDVVAKTARTNLKDTTRVLRALVGVLATLKEIEAAQALERLLIESAQYSQMAVPLHAKPCHLAIEACHEMAQRMETELGITWRHAIHELNSDPYYDARVERERISRVA